MPVGYGDVYPRTLFGRIIILVCSVYGVTVVSLIVVTLTNLLEMDNQEKKVYGLLKRLTIRDNLRGRAAKLIGVLGRYFTAAKKDDYPKKEFLVGELQEYTRKMKKVQK